MDLIDLSFLELIEISTNENVQIMFNEIFKSVLSTFIIVVLLLYFVGLAFSFVKNI